MRLYDLERGIPVKTFPGHQLSISRTVFSPLGNLIVSGSKDSTIRFWDVVSGLCIRTITSHLGEVTSVEMSSNGREMLSCSKDNSNRLWDLRMVCFESDILASTHTHTPGGLSAHLNTYANDSRHDP